MSITIKLVNGKDIRRASFPRDVSFESFQKKAKSSFTFNKREEEYLVCKYQDDEGDLVTVPSFFYRAVGHRETYLPPALHRT